MPVTKNHGLQSHRTIKNLNKLIWGAVYNNVFIRIFLIKFSRYTQIFIIHCSNMHDIIIMVFTHHFKHLSEF